MPVCTCVLCTHDKRPDEQTDTRKMPMLTIHAATTSTGMGNLSQLISQASINRVTGQGQQGHGAGAVVEAVSRVQLRVMACLYSSTRQALSATYTYMICTRMPYAVPGMPYGRLQIITRNSARQGG